MIYILTSKKNGLKVVFKYNSNGLLKAFEIEGDYEAIHLKYLFWNEQFPFPYEIDGIEAIRVLGKFDVEMVSEDLSFERFFESYKYKVSRKRAELLWSKVSKANRIKTFEHLPRYFRHLEKTGQQKAYPDTYIRKEMWDDEY